MAPGTAAASAIRSSRSASALDALRSSTRPISTALADATTANAASDHGRGEHHDQPPRSTATLPRSRSALRGTSARPTDGGRATADQQRDPADAATHARAPGSHSAGRSDTIRADAEAAESHATHRTAGLVGRVEAERAVRDADARPGGARGPWRARSRRPSSHSPTAGSARSASAKVASPAHARFAAPCTSRYASCRSAPFATMASSSASEYTIPPS